MRLNGNAARVRYLLRLCNAALYSLGGLDFPEVAGNQVGQTCHIRNIFNSKHLWTSDRSFTLHQCLVRQAMNMGLCDYWSTSTDLRYRR